MATTATPAGAEKPMVAFALSLVAGLLILVGSTVAAAFFPAAPYYGYGPYYGGMMGGYYGGYYGMMRGFGFGTWWLYGMVAVGIVSGIGVLIGAIMLYRQPSQAVTWGVVILVFSVVSFLGMGGFFVGAILGIVGGILGLTWKAAIASTGR
jgi:hypothetical protein